MFIDVKCPACGQPGLHYSKGRLVHPGGMWHNCVKLMQMKRKPQAIPCTKNDPDSFGCYCPECMKGEV